MGAESLEIRRPDRGGAHRLALAALAALALLAGCAHSPPTEYFSLSSDAVPTEPTSAQATPAHAAAPGRGPLLQVARVHVPPVLDRRQMVRETGPFALSISDTHRWGAPLDEMIQRTLSLDLARVLPANRVVLPQEAAPPGTCRIVLDLLRFEPDAAHRVQLEGGWSSVANAASADATAGRADPTRDPPARDGQPVRVSHAVHLSAPMDGSGYAAQARAMSTVLESLAAQMARSLTSCS